MLAASGSLEHISSHSLKNMSPPKCRSSPLPLYMRLLWTSFFVHCHCGFALYEGGRDAISSSKLTEILNEYFSIPISANLPQWGSQRGASQEVRHHSVLARHPRELSPKPGQWCCRAVGLEAWPSRNFHALWVPSTRAFKWQGQPMVYKKVSREGTWKNQRR